MIILDRAQSFALRHATTDSVVVHGYRGTGKSSLANAIAVEAAEAGLGCLLVGSSPELDRPLVYRTASVCHPILAARSQVQGQTVGCRPRIDPLQARGRLNPAAMHTAMSALRRARELLEKDQLDPEEVEHSLLTARPLPAEAVDLVAVIAQDATRVADMLWTGNRRSGRSLHDVEMAVSGRPFDVPTDEQPLALILAEESRFERQLAAILAAAARASDEKQLSAVVSRLRSAAPADKTLEEVCGHAVWMRQMLGDAIDLLRRSGDLQAALQAAPGTHASRLLELFARQRPRDDADAAIKSFTDAFRQYERDSAALAPHLDRHGSRNIGSIAPVTHERPNLFPPHCASPASFVQKVREARYAARELPGLLGRLRAIVPKALADAIATAPIEEATERVEASGVADARTRSANELRQLRDLFASAGFGDLFAAPTDFSQRFENLASAATETAARHSPQILDLLLNAAPLPISNKSSKLTDWPRSLVRARSQRELSEVAARGDGFDVLVADDAEEFDANLLNHFATAGTRVHRIGSASASNAIPLEIPHRQTNCELADLVSERSARWLAGPGGAGIIVRELGDTDMAFLQTAAGRVVAMLQEAGHRASLAETDRSVVADVVVAVADTLSNLALRSLAECAREGVIVLCRRDARTPEVAIGRPPSLDCVTAQSLGWEISRACTDGVMLEKEGRCVALIDEPAALTVADELVTDIVDRLAPFGWRPIVAWRDAPRERSALNALLSSHAIPISSDRSLHALIECFAFESPLASPVGETADGRDSRPVGASPDRQLDGAVPHHQAPNAPAPLWQGVQSPVLPPAPIDAALSGSRTALSETQIAGDPRPDTAERESPGQDSGLETSQAEPHPFGPQTPHSTEPPPLEFLEPAPVGPAAGLAPPADAGSARPEESTLTIVESDADPMSPRLSQSA